ncbi:MAG: hypothetical protein M3O15_14265 [Acidobacteriota bacterium]|nr:hypothetical protein [Acidobacteriota bacterium]
MRGRSAGFTLLGIYLILVGLVDIIGLHFVYSGILMGVLALLAGILILVGR